jgi:hypothetical protein
MKQRKEMIGIWAKIWVIILVVVQFSNAQRLASDDRVKEIYALIESDTAKWVYGAGAGLDMRSLLLINPRVGTGRSQIGFGVLLGGLAKYHHNKWRWQNNGSIQLAAQKLGLGGEEPWQKNMDILRFSSKLSYDFGTEKWSSAVDFTFQSILLPTYRNSFLRKQLPTDKLTATFFSPAFMNFSPGLGYRPNANYHFLAAPFSFKGVYVLNQRVANLNIYGTGPVLNEEGDTIRFSKSDLRMGFFLRANYSKKYLKDQIQVNTSIDLFSNYLRNPQNLDVLWKADIGYRVWKNLYLNLNTELFYDDNVLVQIDRDGALGLRVSFTSALYVKYNYLF